jgi:hypothetical protein
MLWFNNNLLFGEKIVLLDISDILLLVASLLLLAAWPNS